MCRDRTCEGGCPERGKLTGARVVKLFPVVALNSLDPGAKLGGGVSDEVSKRAESVRFKPQRKRPQIMNAIIKYD